MRSEKILEVATQAIENQLRDSDPVDTKQTLEKLIDRGVPENEAKTMITILFMEEMFQVFKNKNEFNIERYIQKLKEL